MRTKLMVCIAILAMMVVLPTGMAALEVSAFSCNGESGTVNIVEGTSMSCAATITNTDASNAATLNAATLYTAGTQWADSTNYVGSGFDSSIAAGASTTASFSGITPTSSGVHSFNYVDLDGSTAAVTQDANVLDIRSVTATASTSSTTSGTAFTVDASITAGGNMDITVVLSASGCSLSAGEASSKSLGSVADGATQSTSWSVTMGTSSTCSLAVTATGTSGVASVSDTATDSASCSDCSSAGTGGGGAGGGTSLPEKALEAVASGISKIVEALKDVAEAIAELAREHPILFTILVVLIVVAIVISVYAVLVHKGKLPAPKLPSFLRNLRKK